MPDLFVDTSGWGNLVDPTQPHHSLAAHLYGATRQSGRRVITNNYIIAELVTLMASPLEHHGRNKQPVSVAHVSQLVSRRWASQETCATG